MEKYCDVFRIHIYTRESLAFVAVTKKIDKEQWFKKSFIYQKTMGLVFKLYICMKILAPKRFTTNETEQQIHEQKITLS